MRITEYIVIYILIISFICKERHYPFWGNASLF